MFNKKKDLCLIDDDFCSNNYLPSHRYHIAILGRKNHRRTYPSTHSAYGSSSPCPMYLLNVR
jgi:hypothetical protein